MTTKLTAAGAESLCNRLMHVEHIKDREQLRQLGYDAAEEIRRLRDCQRTAKVQDEALSS